MKTYLEAQEIISEEATEEPDFIRADITDKTDSEIAEIKAAIEDIMAGTEYRFMKHLCGHDENRACSTEAIYP
ncbi:MAG: hypothetical protein HY663_02175 [Chloroflexi bacterium]|nr:hypothetical protein [Chloroflexota bacterium]